MLAVLECVECGSAFEQRNRRTVCCGVACGHALGKRRSDATRKANSLARRVRICGHCGAEFTEGNRSLKRRAKFCSRACSSANQRASDTPYASPADAKRAERARARVRAGIAVPVGPRSCTECGVTFSAKSSRHYACSVACSKARAGRLANQADGQKHQFVTFTCKQCGREHTAHYGDKSRVYCGDACRVRAGQIRSRKANALSGKRAAARKARKLRKRGVKVEPVNDIGVLRRDKWTCQLCGVKTPERLRGSFDDRAPEVDHIITLAEGGEHSYRNVQCACRRCNLMKGGASKGQMRLFG